MIKDSINQLISGVAGELGYEIYESSMFLRGENSQIVVKLDKPDGISHLDCEKYSKLLSLRLDDEDLLSNYSLEVSSPGLNRKLRTLEEFKRFTGAPVKVVSDPGTGVIVIKGTVVQVVDNDIIIQEEKREHEIPFDSVINANLDY